MKVTFLHHVNLLVDDLEASTRFYTDVLGLAMRTDRPEWMGKGIWLDIGDRRLSLVEREGTSRRDSGLADPRYDFHVALVVEDLEDAVGELQRADWPISVTRDPLLQVMLQDPSGNWIELRLPPSAYVALAEPTGKG